MLHSPSGPPVELLEDDELLDELELLEDEELEPPESSSRISSKLTIVISLLNVFLLL